MVVSHGILPKDTYIISCHVNLLRGMSTVQVRLELLSKSVRRTWTTVSGTIFVSLVQLEKTKNVYKKCRSYMVSIENFFLKKIHIKKLQFRTISFSIYTMCY